MRETILKTLEEIANNSQINFGSQSAQEMIAEKLDVAISKYIREEISDTIEEIVCPSNEDRCCGGGCHEE